MDEAVDNAALQDEVEDQVRQTCQPGGGHERTPIRCPRAHGVAEVELEHRVDALQDERGQKYSFKATPASAPRWTVPAAEVTARLPLGSLRVSPSDLRVEAPD
ncbi:hypothetical protein LWC35_18525 [Pseudonocardia kujensis]|uniref:hypothetical protein n=1 Tax=Pseudonocardia kujensis TaxID=1128675 RepID=UPI001E53DEEE|nr:hypothetical protein [Pseudonocardia kujensis]MCE0764887.1 hypothetical protein [Pseudonocardia kujensis]